MRVLIVGSGGREHALAWRLGRDPGIEIVAAPGNDGIAMLGACHPIPESDLEGVVRLAAAERVDLVVVGPEAPLAAGLADRLNAARIPCFGPSSEAARLEASKLYAKEVMTAAGVPTARARGCSTLAEVERALDESGAPHVVKVDGLAAGKGVCVTGERAAALAFARAALEEGRFGGAGARVVIEEHLAGTEASVMAVCDGAEFVLLPPARDYKRAFDGDRGSNTGGMGAYAPLPVVDPAMEAEIGATIVAPVLREMTRRGSPYRGVLYCGLMITESGPKVIEFNVRFGDPETQVILPLVGGDLVELLARAARGGGAPMRVARASGAVVAVALVDEGYPDAVRGGGMLAGLDGVAGRPGIHVLIAGAVRAGSEWHVRGGRAAYIVATDDDIEHARARAYEAVETVGGFGWRCRSDIGADAARESRAWSAGGV